MQLYNFVENVIILNTVNDLSVVDSIISSKYFQLEFSVFATF